MPKTVPATTTGESIHSQILQVWRIHNGINLHLLEQIPRPGLMAVPLESRGRTVAEQFAHMNRVRLGWLEYHLSGKRQRGERVEKGAVIPKRQLIAALRKTGDAVEQHIHSCLLGEARVRMFSGQPLRWLGYLISHESHHRGQIALSLKQAGKPLDKKIGFGMWEWGVR